MKKADLEKHKGLKIVGWIKPAFAGGETGSVGCPLLIWHCRIELPVRQVRRNKILRPYLAAHWPAPTPGAARSRSPRFSRATRLWLQRLSYRISPGLRRKTPSLLLTSPIRALPYQRCPGNQVKPSHPIPGPKFQENQSHGVLQLRYGYRGTTFSATWFSGNAV